MALAATTLTSPVALTDTVVNVASASNITAPNYQIGNPLTGISGGVTYLLIEQEMMKVTGVSGTAISVARGELGSQAAAHGSSAPVASGLPADFPGFTPAEQTAVPAYPLKFQGFSAPVASAASIVASGPFFHLTGVASVTNMTAPAGYVEGGEVNIVLDSTASFATGGGGTGPAIGGAVAASAGHMVSFILDLGTNLWYPSHA